MCKGNARPRLNPSANRGIGNTGILNIRFKTRPTRKTHQTNDEKLQHLLESHERACVVACILGGTTLLEPNQTHGKANEHKQGVCESADWRRKCMHARRVISLSY